MVGMPARISSSGLTTVAHVPAGVFRHVDRREQADRNRDRERDDGDVAACPTAAAADRTGPPPPPSGRRPRSAGPRRCRRRSPAGETWLKKCRVSNSIDSTMPAVVRMATVDAATEPDQHDALDPVARTPRRRDPRQADRRDRAAAKPQTDGGDQQSARIAHRVLQECGIDHERPRRRGDGDALALQQLDDVGLAGTRIRDLGRRQAAQPSRHRADGAHGQRAHRRRLGLDLFGQRSVHSAVDDQRLCHKPRQDQGQRRQHRP